MHSPHFVTFCGLNASNFFRGYRRAWCWLLAAVRFCGKFVSAVGVILVILSAHGMFQVFSAFLRLSFVTVFPLKSTFLLGKFVKHFSVFRNFKCFMVVSWPHVGRDVAACGS